MKMICETRTLKDTATEFLAFKKAQKVRERMTENIRISGG